MNYSEEILSQFDRYSAGNMTSDENEQFEASLKEDSDLRQSYEEYLHLKDGLKAFAYNELSDKIAGWESEIVSEKSGTVVPIQRWFMIAATISLLMIAAISWWKFGIVESTDELYMSYYKPYPDILTSRGSGEKLLNEGMYQYESGNYNQAIESLKLYLDSDRKNKEVLFYLGQSYLANEEVEEALTIFSTLKLESSFALAEVNQWYLALTFLKVKNTLSAKEVLQQIIGNTNHAYRERSEKLLEKLN